MSGLEWTAGGAPRSTAFGDIYFNECDGAAEAEFVFIDGNRLAERFSRLPPRGHFTIGELGFGTGLNLLCAWRCFEAHAPADASLTFMTTEALPLSRSELARAHQAFPALASHSARLVATLPPPLPGLHAVALSERVRLLLWVGDAAAGLHEWLPQVGAEALDEVSYAGYVDAWFFDGFAPAKNPAMWTPELLGLAGHLCRPDATCATFTSAGAVRRGLAEAGFEVTKIKGFGTKREMTIGCHPGGTLPPGAPGQAWWRPPGATAPGPVAVIGAGLAGCHTAAALAASGRQVTVFEAGQVAGAASGNPRALLYARFSHRPSTLADFNLAAYGFAASCYGNLGWRGEGLLHVPGVQQARELQAIAARLAEPGLAQWLPSTAAETLAGIPIPDGALWLPGGGALDPREGCRRLLEGAGIELREGQTITQAEPRGSCWRLSGPGMASMEFAAVVLCTAGDTANFPVCQWLPLGAQRGQVTLATLTRMPALPVCGDGYVIPAGKGRAWLGATYAKNDFDLRPRADDDAANLSRAAGLGPGEILAARAGLRATLPDYLPAVGPVPDVELFSARFSAWRRNAKAALAAPCPVLPGLYLNCAHGSRGAAYTPLAAALLAAYMNGTTLPISAEHAAALSPARFLRRALARSKTG